jgi:hypothetical protein
LNPAFLAASLLLVLQLFMTRSLQLEDASLISSLNFCQVS